MLRRGWSELVGVSQSTGGYNQDSNWSGLFAGGPFVGSSGFPVGDGVKIEATETAPDHDFEAFGISFIRVFPWVPPVWSVLPSCIATVFLRLLDPCSISQ